MKNKLLLLLPLIFLNCTNNESILKEEITKLNMKNDSLKIVLDTLKTKFIFDRAFVKHIVNENKPMKVGQKYEGELYFVAYNNYDKILFRQNSNLKPDTLSEVIGGGYKYEFTAKKGENNFYFKPMILNKTAKEFRNPFFDVNIADKKIIE
ncbi:hypothetical protein [Flavobacterium ardleyense]|uniref:hypothetical protein n=1 Tax=Flavobacterium ardleyense TaxID=2038737 RepID=UPI00298D35A1|nr:hypothetical protein [Flavobacterium ardleyense]